MKMQRVIIKNFENIVKPLHEAKKKIREEQVVDLIHKIRKK